MTISELAKKSGINPKVFAEIIDLAFCGGKGDYFTLDIDEETSTLLEFDIINLDKPVRSELLESIEQEGIIFYEKI